MARHSPASQLDALPIDDRWMSKQLRSGEKLPKHHEDQTYLAMWDHEIKVLPSGKLIWQWKIILLKMFPYWRCFPIENGDFPLLRLFTGGYLDLLVSCCSSLVGNKSTHIPTKWWWKIVMNPMGFESVKHQLKQIQVSFLLNMHIFPKHLGNIILNLNFPGIFGGEVPNKPGGLVALKSCIKITMVQKESI